MELCILLFSLYEKANPLIFQIGIYNIQNFQIQRNGTCMIEDQKTYLHVKFRNDTNLIFKLGIDNDIPEIMRSFLMRDFLQV